MGKKIISEQQIIKAAKFLVDNHQSLTISAVRKQLGCRGSNSTIHKYLLKWKQQCFKQFNEQHIFSELNVNFIEEKLNLEQNLNKQIAQNEHYASELVNTEKTIIKLKEEKQQLQTSKQQLQLQLKEAVAINTTLEKLHQELQTRLDHNNNQTIIQQQHIINNLQTELKFLGETSLSALRDTSTQGHEALMQEKLISINLQAKIDGLTKELAEKNKQWELFELKTQVQVRSLQRQIKVQQQALQRFITPEELSELIQSLEPNLLLSGSYGK